MIFKYIIFIKQVYDVNIRKTNKLYERIIIFPATTNCNIDQQSAWIRIMASSLYACTLSVEARG